MDFDDPSCILEGQSVGLPSVQIWDQSFHWRVRNSMKGIFQETLGGNSNQTTLPTAQLNKRIHLSLLYPHSH